jgi:hypothetical protein
VQCVFFIRFLLQAYVTLCWCSRCGFCKDFKWQVPSNSNIPSVSCNWLLTVSRNGIILKRECYCAGDVTDVMLSWFPARKQDIVKLTEQLLTAITTGDFESYTYVKHWAVLKLKLSYSIIMLIQWNVIKYWQQAFCQLGIHTVFGILPIPSRKLCFDSATWFFFCRPM